MGSGKSSVGKELSVLLSCLHIDLDTYIEKKEGKTITEIFSDDGEERFRALEQKALKEILELDDELIISLGGGTIRNEAIAKWIKENGRCFYLKANAQTLAKRLFNDANSRPLLKDFSFDFEILTTRVEKLVASREDLYKKTAHYIVEVDGKSIYQICKEISSLG